MAEIDSAVPVLAGTCRHCFCWESQSWSCTQYLKQIRWSWCSSSRILSAYIQSSKLWMTLQLFVSMDSVRSEWQLLVKCSCNSSSERCESVLRRIVFLNLHLSNLSTIRRVPYFIDMPSLNHFLYHNRLKGLVRVLSMYHLDESAWTALMSAKW